MKKKKEPEPELERVYGAKRFTFASGDVKYVVKCPKSGCKRINTVWIKDGEQITVNTCVHFHSFDPVHKTLIFDLNRKKETRRKLDRALRAGRERTMFDEGV